LFDLSLLETGEGNEPLLASKEMTFGLPFHLRRSLDADGDSSPDGRRSDLRLAAVKERIASESEVALEIHGDRLAVDGAVGEFHALAVENHTGLDLRSPEQDRAVLIKVHLERAGSPIEPGNSIKIEGKIQH
jgi:hypothetical protein